MKTIQAVDYSIHFQEEGYKHLNAYLAENKPSTIFIIVDEHTNENCLPKLLQEMATDATLEIIEIESGEENKNLQTCTHLWEALTELNGDRKSLVINLGGGVITDLGGFVASAFKRGIPFINIPTTLLSMVDASVGGKTGVDLGVLKNQIGFFANPEMVLVDTYYLHSVPDRELRSGLAEVIKYGLTYDAKVWEAFYDLNTLDVDHLIHRSIEIKNEVVLRDPKEQSLRKILNFGHTLGHAIESYFLDSEEKENITHGEAITLGMIMECYISNKLLNFPMEIVEKLKSISHNIYGKIEVKSEDYNGILDLLKHDKKNIGGKVNFVLLKNIEKYKIDCQVENDLLIEALDFYNK
ncbi:3-dehydroquinate synthase [Aureivirga marina]|uniref:3-dehydroquinate synthase n=1 Tax=Aureivirga marina TaxID=1182451 RepID=UPI0018CABAD8|nr:3-dehydroquinate synthase [Aureivirga marina]